MKAPEHLTKEQKGIWNELVGLMPAGVLRAPDVLIVELTVRLLERMRNGTLKVSEVGQLRSCLASLGASPADRSRVEVPVEPEKSLLEQLLDGDVDDCKPAN